MSRFHLKLFLPLRRFTVEATSSLMRQPTPFEAIAILLLDRAKGPLPPGFPDLSRHSLFDILGNLLEIPCDVGFLDAAVSALASGSNPCIRVEDGADFNHLASSPPISVFSITEAGRYLLEKERFPGEMEKSTFQLLYDPLCRTVSSPFDSGSKSMPSETDSAIPESVLSSEFPEAAVREYRLRKAPSGTEIVSVAPSGDPGVQFRETSVAVSIEDGILSFRDSDSAVTEFLNGMSGELFETTFPFRRWNEILPVDSPVRDLRENPPYELGDPTRRREVRSGVRVRGPSEPSAFPFSGTLDVVFDPSADAVSYAKGDADSPDRLILPGAGFPQPEGSVLLDFSRRFRLERCRFRFADRSFETVLRTEDETTAEETDLCRRRVVSGLASIGNSRALALAVRFAGADLLPEILLPLSGRGDWSMLRSQALILLENWNETAAARRLRDWEAERLKAPETDSGADARAPGGSPEFRKAEAIGRSRRPDAGPAGEPGAARDRPYPYGPSVLVFDAFSIRKCLDLIRSSKQPLREWSLCIGRFAANRAGKGNAWVSRAIENSPRLSVVETRVADGTPPDQRVLRHALETLRKSAGERTILVSDTARFREEAVRSGFEGMTSVELFEKIKSGEIR